MTKNLQAPRRVRAYLAANAGCPVLLLSATEEDAERYAKDARFFTDEPVVHLPSRGVLYGDVFDPPVVRVGERQRALRSLSEGVFRLRESRSDQPPRRVWGARGHSGRLPEHPAFAGAHRVVG